jgi:hypothetical protein
MCESAYGEVLSVRCSRTSVSVSVSVMEVETSVPSVCSTP